MNAADDEKNPKLHAAIATLPVRERAIVKFRLSGMTLADIGEGMGLSKERVRQLEDVAHKRLLKSLQGKIKF